MLTGYDIEDYTPVLAVLDQLPEEKRQQYSGDDGYYTVDLLDDALEAVLDHVHVRALRAHEHVPVPQDAVAASPSTLAVKQRHHKQKPHKKK